MNNSPQPPLRYLFTALGLIWLCLFVIAVTGYPILTDNERRIGAYVLDAVENGHWMIQRDIAGDVASKPPMLTWIAGLVTLALGRLTLFALYFPSALATLGVAWLVLVAGRTHFGWQAGFFGGLTYLLSPMADKLVMTARYDGLFTLPVMLGALAAFHAWRLGRGWTWFWLASAMATLVKGPLGLLLAASGLLAAVWEWRSGEPLRLRGNHLPGILIYLVICGGWFALAYWQMGRPLVDKMIGRELIQHSVGGNVEKMGGGFYKPTLSVLSYYLPWTLPGLIACWRVWKTPDPNQDIRRFERFLFYWFFSGLVLFSIGAHHSGRYIFPLMPVLALLTGRELARWLGNLSLKKMWLLVSAAAAFTLIIVAVYHHVLLQWSHKTKDTLALRTLADGVRESLGKQFPLTHVDSPFAIQFYLNTYRPWITQTQAVELLRGDAAAFLVVQDLGKLRQNLGTNVPPLYEFLPQTMDEWAIVRIVSNHPKLEWTDHMAAIFGPLSVQMNGLKLLDARGNKFVLERTTKTAPHFTVSNVSSEPQRVRVQFSHDKPGAFQERRLTPGETWRI